MKVLEVVFYCVMLGSLNSEEIKFLSWEVCLLFSPRENTRALWSGSSGSPAVSLACTSEQFLFNLSIISLRYFPTELPAFQLKNANKGLWLSHWKITILNSSFAASHCIHSSPFQNYSFHILGIFVANIKLQVHARIWTLLILRPIKIRLFFTHKHASYMGDQLELENHIFLELQVIDLLSHDMLIISSGPCSELLCVLKIFMS